VTPTGEILAEFVAALSGLTSQPTIYETFADVIEAAAVRSLVIGPGVQETFEAEDMAGGGVSGVRRFPVRIVCTARSREDAEALRFEVEDALDFGGTLTKLGASFASVSFTDYGGTPEKPTERVYFSSVLDLTVLYQRTAA
jgi:hypothetical protein